MTFEQFQATRTWCEDLSGIADWWDEGEKPKGNLYIGCLLIEHVEPDWPQEARDEGEWHLLLNNCEWITNDLTALERRLYDWAVSEGYFDEVAS
jgi:hypothetical protein